MAGEFLWTRLSDSGWDVLLEDMYYETPLTGKHLSYEEAYAHLADIVKQTTIREERIQVLGSGIGFAALCTVLFSALMTVLQAGVLWAVFHVGTMEITGRFAWVTGMILVSALASAALSKAAIKSFAREPSERQMRLGSTVHCYVLGMILIGGSAYLLLAIWVTFETDTPLYVDVSLTACFGKQKQR